jgi:hypothetical protein
MPITVQLKRGHLAVQPRLPVQRHSEAGDWQEIALSWYQPQMSWLSPGWPTASASYSSLGHGLPGSHLGQSAFASGPRVQDVGSAADRGTPRVATLPVSMVIADLYPVCLCDCVLFSL